MTTKEDWKNKERETILAYLRQVNEATARQIGQVCLPNCRERSATTTVHHHLLALEEIGTVKRRAQEHNRSNAPFLWSLRISKET